MAYDQQLADALREIVALTAGRDRLAAALRKYGRHIGGCGQVWDEDTLVGSKPCDCGLDAALQGQPGEAGSVESRRDL